MSRNASRVGVGMKMSRNDIRDAAEFRAGGASWADVGKRFGVSASTARVSVLRWGPTESDHKREALSKRRRKAMA